MLPALVLARLLPHAFESLGGWSLLFAVSGFILASLPREHSGTEDHHHEHRLGNALVLPALWLHAVTDGATLAMSSSGRVGGGGVLLAAAAILHRVPEGLFVAGHRKRRDWAGALWAVSPLGLATVLGALLGQHIFDLLPDTALDAVLALGAGAMLRLLGHSHGEDSEASTSTYTGRAIAALCFVFGLAAVLAMPDPHDVLTRAQPRELSIALSMWPLFIESSPALLLGLCGMSTLRALLRGWHPDVLLGARGPLAAAWRGLTSGLAQPLGVSAQASTHERLLKAGLPGVAVLALTGAIATLGGDVAALSLQLLGNRFTLARALLCALLVVTCALGAGLGLQRTAAARAEALPAPRGFASTWPVALRDQLEQQAAWLLFGLLLAAALEAGLASEWLADLPASLQVALAVLVAIPGYVSALGATPVAAVLLHKGVSVGAVLAWLCAGPLLNVTSLGVLRRRLGWRAVFGVLAGALPLAAAGGLLVDGFGLVSGLDVPAVHPLLAHRHTGPELGCAAVVAVLLLVTLLRLGPRGFAGALVGRSGRDESGHVNVHVHGHAAVEVEAMQGASDDAEAHLHGP